MVFLGRQWQLADINVTGSRQRTAAKLVNSGGDEGNDGKLVADDGGRQRERTRCPLLAKLSLLEGKKMEQ